MTRASRWLALSTLPAALAGQGPTSDAGTLVVRAGGQAVAREAFQIQSDARGGITLSSTVVGDGRTVALAVVHGRRLTVRLSGAAGETARELPFGPSTVLMDDNVFAFLALLPSVQPGQVQVVTPHSGTRTSGTLADRGPEPVTLADGPVTLHGYELTAGGTTLTAWFDPSGRLVRVLVPARGIEVLREP